MKNAKPLLSVIIMIIAITFFISPDDSVAANATFEKSKYVFYEGNEEKLLLTCNGKEDYFGNWDYYSDDFFSLESSNESVATISYDGVISCRSTGETVITFSCGQVQAKTKIKVKSGGCTLSCDDVTMYTGETTFYTIAIYTSCVKIKKIRFVLVAALLADLAGMITSVIICQILS